MARHALGRGSSAAKPLRRRWVVGLTVLAGVVVLPGVADASVASRSGNLITVTAGAGETNDVTVEVRNFAFVQVTDTAGVTAAGDCTPISATEAKCGAQQFPDVTVALGDGNDTFRVHDGTEFGTFNVDGGPGDDNIIDSGHGTVHGGDGNDIVGGSSRDDQVFGDAGADTVNGGPGKDLIEGDTGIYSDGGSDTIISRDGEVDRVTCGFGTDAVTADSIDVIEGGGECEAVDASAPPTPLTVGLAAKSTAKISSLISRKGFGFRISASSACAGTGKISVAAREARRVGLGRRAVTLVSKHAAVPAAGKYQAALRAASKYRAILRRATSVRTTLTFSCVSARRTKRVSRSVTFKR
jgi:RTX calcium-binding nonapeptide repeat (4 copies)